MRREDFAPLLPILIALGIIVVLVLAFVPEKKPTTIPVAPQEDKPMELGAFAVNAAFLSKTGAERAAIKAQEIIKGDFSADFYDADSGITVRVENVALYGSDAISFYASAWKDGQQIGFGKDGSIEKERFIIHNPPILTFDGTTRTEVDNISGKTLTVKNMSLNPRLAVLRSLIHTITLVGTFNSQTIQPGKIGNTTSTFYPDANAESTSVDGSVATDNGKTTWALAHDAAAGDHAYPSLANDYLMTAKYAANNWVVYRHFYLFNTSAIADTDTIDSATFSSASYAGSNANPDSDTIIVVASTPASNTDLVLEDYDQLGTTALSDTKSFSLYSTGGTYVDFTINATGLAAIDKTGITKFGARSSLDAANSAPTGVNYANIYLADQAGTSADPKLVVVHSAAAAAGGGEEYHFIME